VTGIGDIDILVTCAGSLGSVLPIDELSTKKAARSFDSI